MYASATILLLLIETTAAQQIYDIWQTTWDGSKLFTSLAPASPINFVDPGTPASADIVVSDSTGYQSIIGFGGTKTDSSAVTLNNLKSTNSGNYWNVLQLFNSEDGADAAGLSYLRVPIGASDFSANAYSLDDVDGDTSFSNFNVNNAPSWVFSVIADILSVNPSLKVVHIVPWSPPAWMKTSGSMNGGSLSSNLVSVYPTYLLKAVQGFQNNGIPVFAISIQNEPQNSNPTYPTSTLTPATDGQIEAGLRTLLNNNGLSGVKIIGYDHNWNNMTIIGTTLGMQDDGAAFDGVAFHCKSMPRALTSSKNIYFTECSGTIGSDWWSDIKWYMDNLWIGSIEHYAQSGLMFNIALDADGNPKLPGTNSCPSGCRPIVTVNIDGSYSYNQEFYALAQAFKAILPKDDGGPWGQRIEVSVAGSLGSS
ncbi:glucan endo-1,6-beta-glucosidase [Mycena galericulata]|nr:glucan endo-1,6-beta-glucosidase [Mycena galericulata]